MALPDRVQEKLNARRSDYTGDSRVLLHRKYVLPKAMTLAAAGLERGDFLNDDAAAEIISSRIVEARDGAESIAEVTAEKWLYFA